MDKSTYSKYNKHHVCSDIHLNHKMISVYCPESRGQFVTQTGVSDAGDPIYTHYIDEMNEQIIANLLFFKVNVLFFSLRAQKFKLIAFACL